MSFNFPHRRERVKRPLLSSKTQKLTLLEGGVTLTSQIDSVHLSPSSTGDLSQFPVRLVQNQMEVAGACKREVTRDTRVSGMQNQG
jgi:hypothetical protein